MLNEVPMGKPLDSMTIVMTCPRCEHDLRAVNIGNPADGGTAINGIVRCTNKQCYLELAVHIRMLAVGVYNDEGEAHGNAQAYHRHKRAGEELCGPCREHNQRQYHDNHPPKKLIDA